ncbi:hypothetical protein Pfo_000191 [Paulownia fortunei]|nr:hypothetical protein Pfo_000191 [Paulownia fortunei]
MSAVTLVTSKSPTAPTCTHSHAFSHSFPSGQNHPLRASPPEPSYYSPASCSYEDGIEGGILAPKATSFYALFCTKKQGKKAKSLEATLSQIMSLIVSVNCFLG